MKTGFDHPMSVLCPMTNTELETVNGGSASLELPFISYVTRYIYQFCKTAAEYQASLPPNLKK
jgi:hypothetical protein